MKWRNISPVLCLLLLRASCLPAETFRIEVGDRYVTRNMGHVVMYGELATSDAFPFGFDATFAFNADSSFIAFIGTSGDTFELFIMDDGIDKPVSGVGEGCLDGRTTLEWSPDGSMLVFTRGERVWLYDTGTDSAWRVSEPPESWMEDYDASFSPDGSQVYFFRGSRFEYSFSGDRYSINLDGSGLKKEREEIPAYPPEDLRGEE